MCPRAVDAVVCVGVVALFLALQGMEDEEDQEIRVPHETDCMREPAAQVMEEH